MGALELEEHTGTRLEDLPSLDEAVPCEWNWSAGGCGKAATLRVVTVAARCACGKVTTFACSYHEFIIRVASRWNELLCRKHEARMKWVRSEPL